MNISKTQTLNLESKTRPTKNIDITDHLINRQIRVVNYFKCLGVKDDITYIRLDDINASKKLIVTDNMSRCNSWVTIKIIDIHINIGNSYKHCIDTTNTVSPLTLEWTCKIHKVQGLGITASVISLESEKLKSFRPGHICVALSRVASIKGLFLTSSFEKRCYKSKCRGFERA